MKILLKCILVSFCLLLISCFSNVDDTVERKVYLTLENAFTFQNEKNYNVGDTIFFELSYSRYLPEDGHTNLLDIYETTKSENFGFSFDLLKYSEFEDGFSPVYLNPKFIIAEKKDINSYYYYNNYGTLATLNRNTNIYESRVGIILIETGTFQLNFDNSYIQSPYNYEDDNVPISIFHRFSPSVTDEFEFNVVSE